MDASLSYSVFGAAISMARVPGRRVVEIVTLGVRLMGGARPPRLEIRHGDMALKQKENVPGWPLIASTILLATYVAMAGCTSSSRVDSSETAQGRVLIDDNVINLAVNKRLIDDGLGLFKNVKAVVYRQRVLLIGTVEQTEHRDRAGELVAEVENVAQVMNEIQVAVESGIGAFITDVIIEKSIQSDYLFDDIIDSNNFQIRSVNGTVYMIGHAASRAEFDRALALANATNDVKQVVNYVALGPK